jgi:hypothetical protein
LFTRIGEDQLEGLYDRSMNLLKHYLGEQVDNAPNKSDEVKKLVHISIIMIFIVHATICDAQSSR